MTEVILWFLLIQVDGGRAEIGYDTQAKCLAAGARLEETWAARPAEFKWECKQKPVRR